MDRTLALELACTHGTHASVVVAVDDGAVVVSTRYSAVSVDPDITIVRLVTNATVGTPGPLGTVGSGWLGDVAGNAPVPVKDCIVEIGKPADPVP